MQVLGWKDVSGSWYSIFDFEIVQEGFIVVLRGEAGIAEIAVGVSPVLKTTIIEKP